MKELGRWVVGRRTCHALVIHRKNILLLVLYIKNQLNICTGDWISSVLRLPIRHYRDKNWDMNIAYEIITGKKDAILVHWSIYTGTSLCNVHFY